VPDLKGIRAAPGPDLLVIGSGLGGLCAAAMAARHGLEVLVLEAHDQPGGAAHGFQRKGFAFESGPSLWSGR
jgi:phytoene dehydrogenase-like protein